MSREFPCIYFEKDGKCRKFSDDIAIRYCVMGPCPEKKISIADRLRTSSDEELADELAGFVAELMIDVVTTTTPWLALCLSSDGKKKFVDELKEKYLEVLQQPAEEDA